MEKRKQDMLGRLYGLDDQERKRVMHIYDENMQRIGDLLQEDESR